MSAAMTIEEVLTFLEGEAISYETANNFATNSTRYKREDHRCWEMARLVRDLAALTTNEGGEQ